MSLQMKPHFLGNATISEIQINYTNEQENTRPRTD